MFKNKFYKRPNYRGVGEDVFYCFSWWGSRFEYQNTTGKRRRLKKGEFLGDLIPIKKDEFMSLFLRWLSICKSNNGVI